MTKLGEKRGKMGDAVTDARVSARGDPHWTEMLDAVPGLAFVAEPSGANVFTNQFFQLFTGLSAERLLGQGWIESLHPDDRLRAANAWTAAVAARAPYDEEYRFIGADNEARWFRCRASPTLDADGGVIRWVGVAFDVHRRKQAEEHREIVISELSHRTKNLLTIVQAVARMTARGAIDPDAFRKTLEDRLTALGRVNDLLTGSRWTAVPLGVLVDAEIAPFGDQVAARVICSGPEVLVPAAIGPSLALVVHELLTNAVKYGALSSTEGKVHLEWRNIGSAIHVDWREIGGPPVNPAPSRRGFGSRLINTILKRDLGRLSEYVLAEDGVRCSFSFDTASPAGS